MVAGRPPVERHMIPRWRSVRRTIEAGEFQRRAESRPLSRQQLADLRTSKQTWRAEQTVLAASEFVGASLVAGDLADTNEATQTLLSTGDPCLTSLATSVDGSRMLTQAGVALSEGDFRRKAAKARQRTVSDPRNAVAWADLARHYTALGQTRQAKHALRIARGLAPSSRYLLRITSRFLVHVGDPEAALQLLRDSPRTPTDPWLMSASLGVASVAGKRVTSLKNARRILEDENFRPVERSDLAAELATILLEAGTDKKSKRLFERSIKDPTDNSLAQAEWASHRIRALGVDLNRADVAFPSEALSRSALEEGKWEIALTAAMQWLQDQPFDSTAAETASYVAVVGLEDWPAAMNAAQIGLRASPANAILRNNLAFALIELGELDEAQWNLQQSFSLALASREPVALQATRGLLAFRRGHHAEGRAGYREAIGRALTDGDREGAAMARSMQLREEVRVGNRDEVVDLCASLEKDSSRLREVGVVRSVERATELAAKGGLLER